MRRKVCWNVFFDVNDRAWLGLMLVKVGLVWRERWKVADVVEMGLGIDLRAEVRAKGRRTVKAMMDSVDFDVMIGVVMWCVDGRRKR